MGRNIKDKKMIKIVVSIIILLALLVAILLVRQSITKQSDQKEIEKIKSYTTMDEFKSVEEVAKYMECNYIKEETSKEENYKLDIYMQIKVLPYSDDTSNEAFYNNLISYCAKVLKFENFRIIDKKNNITIEVICDKEKEAIKSIIINGESDYFAKRDSETQIKNYKETKQINITVQSEILKNLINNKWRLKESDIGTKESTFNSYDIYFDEGVEVRRVDNKVFNIVFTDKYKQSVANNITTATSKEAIIKRLGTPTFEDLQTGVFGYKGNEIYVFFNTENEISIYSIFDTNEQDDKFTELIDSYLNDGDINNFRNKLKNLWTDYNKAETKQENVLQYALKGFEIYDSNINIYSNFKSKLYKNFSIDDLKTELLNKDKIQFKNLDLVFKNELDRNKGVNSTKYALDNFVTVNYDENQNENNKKSNNKFLDYKEYSDKNIFSVKFISKTKEYANSELKEYVNYGMWINENIYIYSIKNKGIYMYNAITRKYGTLIEGNDEFKLISCQNNIIKYDEKQIKLK